MLRLGKQVNVDCAETMLENLAAIVLEGLKKQNGQNESQILAKSKTGIIQDDDAVDRMDIDDADSTPENASSSFVKITTIKLLAYLLAKSNFVSLIISLDISNAICRKPSH